MKKFLITIIGFAIALSLTGELIIRIFRLVPDIPERYVDNYGIQRYKPGQAGYYTKAKEKWQVNDYGWLGTHENKNDSTLTIIGDSFIENMMNPLACNQGSILKNHFSDYSFFEAGRSGVTFIEAMEISKVLETEIQPKYQLLYLNEHDFYESVSEITRYPDRLQISLANKKLIPSGLKSPGLKKVLYNIKLLYYLYLKYPIFVKKQNKGEIPVKKTSQNAFDSEVLQELVAHTARYYDLEKLIFVFHPNTNQKLIEIMRANKAKTVLLDASGDSSWAISSQDNHWSCYGHKQVGKQVAANLKDLLQ